MPGEDGERSFIHISENSRFGVNSTKKSIDVNGGNVNLEDPINFVITLKNDSGSNVNNLMVSDLLPISMVLDPASLSCLDAGCSDKLEWVETGMTSRSHVIKGISVPAYGTRTIKYSMIVTHTSEVHFDIGNDFTEYKKENGETVAVDNHMDILVRPAVNPNGILTYLYSTGVNAKGHVKYEKMTEFSSGGGESANPDDIDSNPSLSTEAQKKIQRSCYADADYDGLPDSWSFSMGYGDGFLGEDIANGIQGVLDSLKCGGGGCLPIPFNMAFFAPDGAIPGTAVFAAGTPSPPFFMPFYSSLLQSSFRFYINPTLTMGLGTSFCIGQPPLGFCFPFAVPLSSMGLCPDFLGPIMDAITTAKNAVVNPDVGMSTVVSDGTGAQGTESLATSFSDPNAGLSANISANIKIPGFPSVITNWLDNQTDEIFNKLLDLPNFYFIYPDVKTLVSEHAISASNFDNIKNINDFLRALNSIPLIQIESKEVMLKIPMISQDELEKWKRQAQLWIKYEEDQIKKIDEYWNCDADSYRKTVCDKFRLNLGDLIESIRTLLSAIDTLVNLPRQILNWRQAESKYATQIVCYLDAIMQFTGGYLTKQQKTVESWMKAVEDILRAFKSWSVLLDLIVDYQVSCDKCTTDRYSKLGLLMNFFVAIPDIPIIPIPKWPDIVFDISQIKTGVKIVWPDLVFKPAKVNLPNLPQITIPEILPPDIVLNIPGFDIPDWLTNFPNFELPNLPDLPPLPLPNLPDLPRPPKIPKLPDLIAKILLPVKMILKILCLLKNALIPIPEASLATEIETLTQPSVQAVLPLMMAFGIELPAIQYDYVEQIKVTTKIDMGIETDAIYTIIDKFAEASNEGIDYLIEELNNYTSWPIQNVIDNAIKQALDEAEKAIQDAILDEAADAVGDASDEISYEDYPETIYLSATESYLDPDDPLLNRTIEEIDVGAHGEYEGMEQIIALQDALIDYTKNISDSTELIAEIDDYDEFVTMIADSDESLRHIASLTNDYGESGDAGDSEVNFGIFDEGVQEALVDASKIDSRLLADNSQPSDDFPIDISKYISVPATTPKGFYVIKDGKNESVLSYTDELSSSVKSLFSDVDADGDTDIVYSMGGDLYLKENYENSPSTDEGDLIINNKNSVSDYVNKVGTSVMGISSPYESHEKADLSWLPVDDKTYEIVLRRSLRHDLDDYFKMETSEEDDISFEIENGYYYANIYAVDEDGKKSIVSDHAVLAPQSCADKDAPFPAGVSSYYLVPILKGVSLDASASFDPSGEVEEYEIELPSGKSLWSDINSGNDDDGDGIAWNDKNNSFFKVGPFESKEDVGEQLMKLKVSDQSGYSSSQEIVFDVFIPNITLDPLFATSSVASGYTDPFIASYPFALMRKRFVFRVSDEKLSAVQRIDKISTSSVANDEKYYTDFSGKYEIKDFDLEDMIWVENSEGEIVAEIHPETGNIKILKDGYNVIVNPASFPLSPSSVFITDNNGVVLGTIYLFADPNVDVQIDNEVLDGVTVVDVVGDDFSVVSYGADDELFPGGAAIIYNGQQIVLIDTSGNVIVLDDAVTLRQKQNDHNNDPFVIEVLYNGSLIAEIYISTLGDLVHIVGPNDVPFPYPRVPINMWGGENGVGAGLFVDVDGEFAYDLFKKGIIDGKQTDKGLVLGLDDVVTRAEFVKILLNMLCITPSDEAYEADSGFSDISYKAELDWYYPYVKEASLLGLIHGYKGEVDSNGLSPFKPDNTISRAEAVKIILEALEYKGVLDLADLSIGDPWYEPFVKAGENLTPYMADGQKLKNNFIINENEATLPEKDIKRGQLIDMVYRVLEIFNCFDIDNDNDDMSDFCETKYGVSDPNADADGDGLTNLEECELGLDPTNKDTDGGGSYDNQELIFGTDPLNPIDDPIDDDNDGLTNMAETLLYKTDPFDADTDDGGVNDGDEVKNRTNPLDPSDDYDDVSLLEGESGIFIVPADCNTCPCISTFLHKAEVIPGDIFYSVISSFDEKTIFSKSKEVIIQSISK